MSVEQVETQSVQIAGCTDVGNERDGNEDRFLAMRPEEASGNPWRLSAVLMVADGVGGHDAGEVASGMASDIVHEYFVQGRAWTAQTNGSNSEIQEAILDVIAFINRKVFAYGAAQQGHPATTLTLCLCREGSYHIGHVGDSRAYLLTDQTAAQITDDDSWVADAVRQGKMTQSQAESSPFRNQLTKSIGTTAEVTAAYYSGPLSGGDALLLCSDGLSEYVQAGEIQGTLCKEASLQSACEILIELAKHRGGHDNITVAAAGFGARALRPRKPPTQPIANPKPPTRRFLSPGSLFRDPNRVLLSVLFLLICAASTVLGLYAGRRWERSRPRTVISVRLPAGDSDPEPTIREGGAAVGVPPPARDRPTSVKSTRGGIRSSKSRGRDGEKESN